VLLTLALVRGAAEIAGSRADEAEEGEVIVTRRRDLLPRRHVQPRID